MNIINNKNKRIIAALATPNGRSAVAIIRISGDGCIEFTEKFLSSKLKANEMRFNTFKSGDFSEHLMAVCYKAPKSFTGEDTVELFPHGNMTVCDSIIKALVGGGASIAERGEFTKRAFLNGKLDLMQCEALADIIDAQTAEQLYYGNKRFDGGFKGLATAEKLLKTALSSVEAVLHYGDELEGGEADEAIVNDVYGAIDTVSDILNKEVAGYAGGRIINDGYKIALVGAPNVGKSTLLNALLGSERAIVTEIAGTTRDTVDGDYVYNGRKFTVTDTAGIRENGADKAENMGIERAYKAAEVADAVVLVSANGVKAPIMPENAVNLVAVENKCDSERDVGSDYKAAFDADRLKISAKNGTNITALKQLLWDMCPKDFGSICNQRQYSCAVRCLESLNAAKKEKNKAEGLEIVAALLYEAYSAITEMYGEQADENIISAVFERFCVGK